MNFLLDNCTFCELTQDVINSCGEFTCGKDADIHEFFHSEYQDYSTHLLGKSYCFVENKNPGEIVCAFTVANSSIKVDGLPNKKRNKLNRKIPHAIRHAQYPAVLVGQIAVFDKYKGRQIGDELMNFIKSWFIEPLNKTGCRYVIVDAVNHEKVRSFYESNGFQYIFSSDNEEFRYMTNSSDRDSWLHRIKNMLCHSSASKSIYRKTRLMFYDLIVLYSKA